jgi:preprotein translocase subunit SecD
MHKYPTWKYILVLIVLTYAVIYSLPNFYNTYPSINVTTFENKEISKEDLLTLSKKHKFSNIGVDGNSIFFESIDNQLKAYNKLSQEKLYQYTLSNYNQIPRWLSAINANPVSLGT